MQQYTYWLLIGFTIIIPLAFSFEKQIQFYKKIPALLAGIFIAGAVFIAWDVWFTSAGVWHFNPDYTLDERLFHLPLEEWAFFLVIPYASVFIYEVEKYYMKYPVYQSVSLYITAILFFLLIALAIIHQDKLYTLVNFSFAALLLLIQFLIQSHKTYLTTFYIAYATSLLPFLVVNGILTALPVVRYNNSENLSIRVFTIPVEDFIYLLGHLLLVISIYEWIRRKTQKPEVYG